MKSVPAGVRRGAALPRKRRGARTRTAFENDPIRIVDAAREIAAFDGRLHDEDRSAYKRTRQRIIDAIKRGKLSSDQARKLVGHQVFCQWAMTTWGTKSWFAGVREIKGFRIAPSVASSTASLPIFAGQGEAFEWFDDHAWLRDHYRAAEGGRLQLFAENRELKRRINELDSEVKRYQEQDQARSNAARRSRMQREIKKRR